jgi:hypothetical protein
MLFFKEIIFAILSAFAQTKAVVGVAGMFGSTDESIR